jgi:hypothetical protein
MSSAFTEPDSKEIVMSPYSLPSIQCDSVWKVQLASAQYSVELALEWMVNEFPSACFWMCRAHGDASTLILFMHPTVIPLLKQRLLMLVNPILRPDAIEPYGMFRRGHLLPHYDADYDARALFVRFNLNRRNGLQLNDVSTSLQRAVQWCVGIGLLPSPLLQVEGKDATVPIFPWRIEIHTVSGYASIYFSAHVTPNQIAFVRFVLCHLPWLKWKNNRAEPVKNHFIRALFKRSKTYYMNQQFKSLDYNSGSIKTPFSSPLLVPIPIRHSKTSIIPSIKLPSS